MKLLPKEYKEYFIDTYHVTANMTGLEKCFGTEAKVENYTNFLATTARIAIAVPFVIATVGAVILAFSPACPALLGWGIIEVVQLGIPILHATVDAKSSAIGLPFHFMPHAIKCFIIASRVDGLFFKFNYCLSGVSLIPLSIAALYLSNFVKSEDMSGGLVADKINSTAKNLGEWLYCLRNRQVSQVRV